MPPRIQETPSGDEEELDLQSEEEEVDSEEEDQLESDAPESSPQTSRAATKAPAARRKSKSSKPSSEMSSVAGQDDQADELASDMDVDETASTSTKGKDSIKLKLKLGDEGPTPVNPALERTRSGGRRASASSSVAGSTRGKGKKRARDDDESDPEDWSDSGSEAPDPTRMTARQRAKEAGETVDASGFLELPSTSKKGKYDGLTAEEVALKRTQDTRKRQNQLAKRLEDEKQETVNKLLKKQTGQKGKKGRRKKGDEEEVEGEGAAKAVAAPVAVAPPPPPAGYRHISSIRSGEFGYVLAIPAGSEDLFKPSMPPQYPGPRPPPPTRRLVTA